MFSFTVFNVRNTTVYISRTAARAVLTEPRSIVTTFTYLRPLHTTNSNLLNWTSEISEVNTENPASYAHMLTLKLPLLVRTCIIQEIHASEKLFSCEIRDISFEAKFAQIWYSQFLIDLFTWRKQENIKSSYKNVAFLTSQSSQSLVSVRPSLLCVVFWRAL